jgi:nicotinic acid mononucleotide adenylyltransferase
MGRNPLRMILIALLCAGYGVATAFGKALTVEDVQKAKTITIYMGTFDPVTVGHFGLAEAAVKEGGSDLVIFLPRVGSSGKKPVSLADRAKMIEIAVGDHPHLAYLTGDLFDRYTKPTRFSTKDFLSHLRSLNPHAKYAALVGQDIIESKVGRRVTEFIAKPDLWFVGPRESNASIPLPRKWVDGKAVILHTAPTEPSSSKVRRFLNNHLELYSPSRMKTASFEGSMLDRQVAQYIVENKLYLGRVTNRRLQAMKETVKGTVKKLVNQAGLFETLRNHKLSKITPSAVLRMEVEGELLEGRLIGSGLTSSAYRVQYRGRDAVVKLAHPTHPYAKEVNLQTRSIQTILSDNPSGIKTPGILYSDPEGKFIVSEFIQGESLRDLLAREGSVPDALIPKLQALVGEAQRVNQEFRIKLDLRSDNIILREGEPYLVDLGPMGPRARMPASYDEVHSGWKKEIRPASTFQICVRGLLNFLSPVPVPH